MAITSERGEVIFKRTEQALLRLRKGYPPNAIHRFRTTARRLQVLLEELTPARARNEKKLLKALGRIRRRAGRIRDIDIQLTALRSLKVPVEPRRKTELTHRLIDLRRKHEQRLRKLLKKQDIAEIVKRLRRASKGVEVEASGRALDIARRMLGSVADGSARIADEYQLHRYRLAVKRARYAAEFAPKSAEAAQFIAQLKNLQDSLGRWHDWFTLTQTARQQLGEIHQSSLVAALHNVTRGKFREASRELSVVRFTPGSLKLVPARQDSKETALTLQPGTAA